MQLASILTLLTLLLVPYVLHTDQRHAQHFCVKRWWVRRVETSNTHKIQSSAEKLDDALYTAFALLDARKRFTSDDYSPDGAA